MNVLFITLGNLKNINQQGVYTDLIKEFSEHGHNVYAICPMERRYGHKSVVSLEKGIKILYAKTGNITQCSFFEKGISTLLIKSNFKKAIKKFLKGKKFDLVIYSTPPITVVDVVKYIKYRDNANTFLLLKDIFPQNAVDLKLFSNKSIIYKYFRQKEKQLYNISDYIGCMSKANISYITAHNKNLNSKVVLAPNSIKPDIKSISQLEKEEMRLKYKLPLNRKIFVYGGNLGKPQGIDFMLKCLNKRKDKDEYYIIAGSGTEFNKAKSYFNEKKQCNVKLIDKLPKDEYEKLVKSCDAGLIFLDYRFTIPNYPSRLLSYMQAGLPTLACVDENTDIGTFLETNKIGLCCTSNNIDEYSNKVDLMLEYLQLNNMSDISNNVHKVLLGNYTSEHTYSAIIDAIES